MANKIYSYPDTTDWDTFKVRFRQLMDSHNLSVAKTSELIHISKTTLFRYFNERTPDIVTLARIADYFHVTIDWLIGRTDKKYDSLSDEERNLLDKYTAASESDRLVIQTVLQKYE